MRFDEYIDLLKGLARQPSVVGSEHAFFRVLQRELEDRGAEVRWYEGVLVAQGRNPQSCLFSAHVDRHGLICTGPNEFQYAAFVAGNRSDLLGNSVSEQFMNKISGRVQGRRVVAYEPWSGSYFGQGYIDQANICEYRNNLVFDVKGLEHVVAGTPVAFSDRLRIDDNRISAQLDNVLTVAMLVHLFSLGYQGTAFFTAQEEAGSSWRFLLEWFRRFGASATDLIVLDTSPYSDVAEADEQEIVLRRKDANAVFSETATDRVVRICEELGAAYSFKDVHIEARNIIAAAEGRSPQSIGSTEMGRIAVASEGRVGGTTLQIPTTGYHTTEESAAIESCRVFLKVLSRIAHI